MNVASTVPSSGRARRLAGTVLCAAVFAASGRTAAAGPGDVPFVPTPEEVVPRMLALAGVRSGDVVYDLGCGDGRIVIAAVKKPGVRGVCVEIDPDRVALARANAEQEGVAGRIRFVEGDLFKVPLDEATVVALYLLPDVNLRLRPRLLRLRPGTRIVSHAFDMGDWPPARKETVHIPIIGDALIYLWTVPQRKAP
jgi:SAM-dependent methyltransferase